VVFLLSPSLHISSRLYSFSSSLPRLPQPPLQSSCSLLLLSSEFVRLWSHNRKGKLRNIYPTELRWGKKMKTRHMYNGSIIAYRLPFFYHPREHMRVYWLVVPFLYRTLILEEQGRLKRRFIKNLCEGNYWRIVWSSARSNHNSWLMHSVESKNKMILTCDASFPFVRLTL
jgi:hypothetical protein